MKVLRSRNRLYKINLKIDSPVCLMSKLDEPAWLWHARMGHLNFESLSQLSSKDMVRNLPKITHVTNVCDACQIGKQTRLPFPSHASFRATKPLELIHADLCGPLTPETWSSNKYMFVMIDDFSRYMWCSLLNSKDQTFSKFKRSKGLIEAETCQKMVTLRTDRGGEFTSREFNQWCEDQSIRRNLTAPYTPQQNGVVERRNRTLVGMI
ncbi:hypothetical protein E3N88_05527 [Mikania micrantha]|uniref:Integrase catalytic domain-containing protein n=1 Tax=Mikania micrantha TaxID=192012 RepID=A0A5N6PM08_9ASTR|nr:hypothetical protein E3N88_05527 [Mikania micrantha]